MVKGVSPVIVVHCWPTKEAGTTRKIRKRPHQVNTKKSHFIFPDGVNLLPDTFASRAPPVSTYNGSHFLQDKGYFNQITVAIFTCMYIVYLQKHPSFCRFVKMAHPSHRGSTSFVSSSVSNIAWHYHTSLGLTELHACTTSMRWGLKDSTYCSSSSSSLASMETRAIRRAESCVQGREASHNIYNLVLFTVSPIT